MIQMKSELFLFRFSSFLISSDLILFQFTKHFTQIDFSKLMIYGQYFMLSEEVKSQAISHPLDPIFFLVSFLTILDLLKLLLDL